MVADARASGEHRPRRLLERDRDDPRALGHPLPGAEVERHARPAPVVDVALERNERLGLRVVGDAVDVAVAVVLSSHHVGGVDRQHRPEDLVLLLVDGIRLQRSWRLHRGERQHLEQVGDHHVSVGAGPLVERCSLVQAEVLGYVDLNVVDVVPVPDRLEQPVGEPERQDVLRGLLAEEVVDPEDLLLVEHLVQPAVQLAGRRQVDAERLLHHDPAVRDQVRIAQGLHHCECRLRWHAQVVEPAHLSAPLRLRVGHDAPQSLGALRAGRPAQQLGELGPRREIALGRGVGLTTLPHRLLGEGHERVRRVVVQRGAHNPDVFQQAGLEQVQETRQQLAASQVAGGAEQDDGGRVESHAPSLPQNPQASHVGVPVQTERVDFEVASRAARGTSAARREQVERAPRPRNEVATGGSRPGARQASRTPHSGHRLPDLPGLDDARWRSLLDHRTAASGRT